jgi:hypothetical protein
VAEPLAVEPVAELLPVLLPVLLVSPALVPVALQAVNDSVIMLITKTLRAVLILISLGRHITIDG